LVLPASSGKRLLPRDPQDDVAAAFARASHRAEPIRHRVLNPDGALAALVGLVLVAHRAKRERPGYGLERLGGDADHAAQRLIGTTFESAPDRNAAQSDITLRRSSSISSRS
jgi:hypothetical protein